ncbi:calmodulin calcium-dependent NAD kinase-like isoform X2 [Lotus japonicus]|uniref:calmodulin calcium-dependent NAD kinase-like isoform X2 n=1 Tax=Lotus japonicus TaxID=34305 RepID=UPI002586A128|nr:calmodulin calcium-dependent NAD kinase-like isoform X2 [Lotus japonicus]
MQQNQDGSADKVTGFAHVLAASFASLVAAAAHHWRPEPSMVVDKNIIPHLERTESGRVARIEKFSHYVARQIGFEEEDQVPALCIVAQDYLRKSKGCDQSIYEYLANENDAGSLYVKLVDEFERCILSYFAFHWTQAPSMISQVLNTESQQKTKLKEILLAATRKQRFDRITKDLKVTRVFSTLVEEMKAFKGDSQCKDVMVPIAHSERSPVLMFMGGGMGAGKSTVLKDILKEPFWLGAATNAVVVEADAFKERDVIYRALSSRGHHDDMLQTAELVHQSSTDAASSLLVTALNEGRDVIMDGTLSWEPFVEQTIAMARNVHKCKYRMGVGYKLAEDGTVTEKYWEQVNEAEEEHQVEENSNAETQNGKPYRIELVGVVCDGYLAVIRGMRRSIMTGRAVRVNSQLKSHKRFANAFPRYCKLVDNARLFSTNSIGGPPKSAFEGCPDIGRFTQKKVLKCQEGNLFGFTTQLIGWKDGVHNLLVDPEDIKCLKNIGSLNAEADSIYELYRESNLIKEPGSVWNDFVMSPSRPNYQKELRESILKIEKSITENVTNIVA